MSCHCPAARRTWRTVEGKRRRPIDNCPREVDAAADNDNNNDGNDGDSGDNDDDNDDSSGGRGNKDNGGNT